MAAINSNFSLMHLKLLVSKRCSNGICNSHNPVRILKTIACRDYPVERDGSALSNAVKYSINVLPALTERLFSKFNKGSVNSTLRPLKESRKRPSQESTLRVGPSQNLSRPGESLFAP